MKPFATSLDSATYVLFFEVGLRTTICESLMLYSAFSWRRYRRSTSLFSLPRRPPGPLRSSLNLLAYVKRTGGVLATPSAQMQVTRQSVWAGTVRSEVGWNAPF